MTRDRPTLLLTRPEPAARRFLNALSAAGDLPRVLVSPLMRIDPLPIAVPDGALKALVLTSEHGAVAAARLGLPAGLVAWCVGDRTAQAAQAAGFAARSASGDADALFAAILASDDRGPFLHLRGAHTRGDLAQRLSLAGRPCLESVAYRQTALPPDPSVRLLLDGHAPVIAPLFSPRSALLLAQLGPATAPLHVVAISAAVAAAAARLCPTGVTTAPQPDAAAMIDATLAALAAFDTR